MSRVASHTNGLHKRLFLLDLTGDRFKGMHKIQNGCVVNAGKTKGQNKERTSSRNLIEQTHIPVLIITASSDSVKRHLAL